MEVSAKMVKDLRECTGAGMMDCKKALTEAGGDMDAAIDILRTKGLAALAKKAGRATNEGVIGGFVAENRLAGALVEVNCETDFVAINSDFKTFVSQIAAHVTEKAPADVEALLSQPFMDRPETFEAVLGETVGRIGENIGVARFTRYEMKSDFGAVTIYIHGIGKIGVMIEVSASNADAATSEAFAALGRNLAMQVAAAAPIAVDREGIPHDVTSHEFAIYKAQAAESGKPEDIQVKMAEGRLEKFYKDAALLEQVYVKDSDITVRGYVDSISKDLGALIEVVRFERFVLGETASSVT